jgi:hypothetical protein
VVKIIVRSGQLFDDAMYLQAVPIVDQSAADLADEISIRWRAELERRASAIAERQGYERVMRPHVLEADRELHPLPKGSDKLLLLLQGAGGILLGAGLSSMVSLLGSRPLSPSAAILTFVLIFLGAALYTTGLTAMLVDEPRRGVAKQAAVAPSGRGRLRSV